jgi:hypothetical protein
MAGRARRPDDDLGAAAKAAGFAKRFPEAHLSLLRGKRQTIDTLDHTRFWQGVLRLNHESWRAVAFPPQPPKIKHCHGLWR